MAASVVESLATSRENALNCVAGMAAVDLGLLTAAETTTDTEEMKEDIADQEAQEEKEKENTETEEDHTAADPPTLRDDHGLNSAGNHK